MVLFLPSRLHLSDGPVIFYEPQLFTPHKSKVNNLIDSRASLKSIKPHSSQKNTKKEMCGNNPPIFFPHPPMHVVGKCFPLRFGVHWNTEVGPRAVTAEGTIVNLTQHAMDHIMHH